MGLDMYAYKVARKETNKDVGQKIDQSSDWYWRKFNHLHGWMHRLYTAKGGTDPDFNCVSVRVSLEDLEQLEKDARTGNLPAAKGFFFGGPDYYPEDHESLLRFIEEAREAINDGYDIYYSAWY